MLQGRHISHLGNIERSIARHYCTSIRQQVLPVVKSSRYHSRRDTVHISCAVPSFFCVRQRHLRSFGSTRILGKQPPAMSPSPAKKQKVSANANEHLEQEPHEMSAIAGEVDRDPYPQGTDHESRGKHDTTTTHQDEEREKQKEGGEWRNQPPYRTSPENEHFDKKHTAECNCGRIRYWLSRDAPIASKYCHCKDCQSLHGAPLQWAAVFKKEDLHFENGAKGLAFYHSEKKHTYHDLPCKVSCAYCHAPIMDEGRNMVLMFPAIIKFKDEKAKKSFDPTMHIFYSRRVLDIPDGKPKWTGLDEKSDLMKDVD